MSAVAVTLNASEKIMIAIPVYHAALFIVMIGPSSSLNQVLGNTIINYWGNGMMHLSYIGLGMDRKIMWVEDSFHLILAIMKNR
jgi:hypothetical protein